MKCEKCGSAEVTVYVHEFGCNVAEWCVCNVCGATSPEVRLSIDADLRELFESQFDTEGE